MDFELINEELLQTSALRSKLLLVMGKGGVGKTTLSRQLSVLLASKQKKVLHCKIEDNPNLKQKLTQRDQNLSELNLNPKECFEEYIHLKLRIKTLADLLLNSHVIQYFEKAAPGVRELVLLGKLWHEMSHYDHVVVDMPSTGYALTMIHTPFNFSKLFPIGPIATDMKSMVKTFSAPQETAFIAVCLPEEMPIQESIELQENLKKLIPENPLHLIMNRVLHIDEDIPSLLTLSQNEHTSLAMKALQHLKLRADKQAEHLHWLKNSQHFNHWTTVHEH